MLPWDSLKILENCDGLPLTIRENPLLGLTNLQASGRALRIREKEDVGDRKILEHIHSIYFDRSLILFSVNNYMIKKENKKRVIYHRKKY